MQRHGSQRFTLPHLPVGERMSQTAGMAAQPTQIYYGWIVLLAIFMAGFMVYGGGLYSFVLFVPPLTAEFHWSRAATSSIVTAFWLSAPLILLGGSAIKRFGAKKMLITGIFLEALCLILLALVSSFWQMYLLRALMGVGKVMFAVTLPYVMSIWFSRRYSLSLALAWAGWHVGGLVLAPLTSYIIQNHGWRTACCAIAAGLLTIAAVPVLLTQKAISPKSLGIGLDGDPIDTSSDPKLRPSVEDAPGTVSELLRSSMFWMIALVSLFFFTTYGGLLTHEAAVVEGAGFSPTLASLVLSSTAGFAAVGGLTVGWFLDNYSVRVAGIVMHGLLFVGALSLLIVTHYHSPLALVGYAVCFGITIGGGDLYFVALMRRRFAHISVAHSYSAWYFCQILTLLVSGPAAGRVFDLTGNYNQTLTLLACSALLSAALAIIVMRKPGLERCKI